MILLGIERSFDALFTSISSGKYHTCASGFPVTQCWGRPRATPPSGSVFMSISSSEQHTCGLTFLGGTAQSWGGNPDGRATPPSGSAFTSISSGCHHHTCGLTFPGGTAQCWGHNGNDESAPPSGSVFMSISSGCHHTCGLTFPGGTAQCWGGMATAARRRRPRARSSGPSAVASTTRVA